MNLRKRAKGRACNIRGSTSESVVLAHLRVGGNAGIGIKPPDHHALHACYECHLHIDGPGRGDHKLQLIGYMRFIDELIADGVLVWAEQ